MLRCNASLSASFLLLSVSICGDAEVGAQANPRSRGTTNGQAGSTASLQVRLRHLLRQLPQHSAIGVRFEDAATGEAIFDAQGKRPLNPASNMKVLTAAATLRELGPSYRFATLVRGERDANGRVADLVVQGFGDPSLEIEDLMSWAYTLRSRGVHTVDRIAIDVRAFDAQSLPPAFEQQPEEFAAFRASVAAFAVQRAAYRLRVFPPKKAGESVRVRIAGEGFFAIDSALHAIPASRRVPQVIAVETPRTDGSRGVALSLSGAVIAGSPPMVFRRRLDAPHVYAAFLLRDALRSAGIAGRQRLVDALPETLPPVLIQHRSAPLAQLLRVLNKYSDNFTAEMLLKQLGMRPGRPATFAAGAGRLLRSLAACPIDIAGAKVVNGSGLFDANRISAAQLVATMRCMRASSALWPEFLASLAVGGRDGTLASRLAFENGAAMVRAKTGTLRAVIALSGVVQSTDPGRAALFSILFNNVAGARFRARKVADRLVGAVAACIDRPAAQWWLGCNPSTS